MVSDLVLRYGPLRQTGNQSQNHTNFFFKAWHILLRDSEAKLCTYVNNTGLGHAIHLLNLWYVNNLANSKPNSNNLVMN